MSLVQAIYLVCVVGIHAGAPTGEAFKFQLDQAQYTALTAAVTDPDDLAYIHAKAALCTKLTGKRADLSWLEMRSERT